MVAQKERFKVMRESFMQNTIPRMLAEQALGMKNNKKTNNEGGMERNHGDCVNCTNRGFSENALNQANQTHFYDPGTLKGAERGGKSGRKLKRSGDSVN